MDIPVNPILLLILQGVSVLFTGVVLFLLGQVFRNLKENTASTHSIALTGARTDEKVVALVARVEIVAQRTHNLGQDVAQLVAIDKVRAELAAKGGRRGGD